MLQDTLKYNGVKEFTVPFKLRLLGYVATRALFQKAVTGSSVSLPSQLAWSCFSSERARPAVFWLGRAHSPRWQRGSLAHDWRRRSSGAAPSASGTKYRSWYDSCRPSSYRTVRAELGFLVDSCCVKRPFSPSLMSSILPDTGRRLLRVSPNCAWYQMCEKK